jgi:hypothetical protein
MAIQRTTLAQIEVGDRVRLIADPVWSFIPTQAQCRKGEGAYVEVIAVTPGRPDGSEPTYSVTLHLADGTRTFGGRSTRVNRVAR